MSPPANESLLFPVKYAIIIPVKKNTETEKEKAQTGAYTGITKWRLCIRKR